MSLSPETLGLQKLSRQHYLSLSSSKCQVTYVWIDQDGQNPKGKTRTLDCEPRGIQDIPNWYCTYAANERVGEATLVPVAMFQDPFTLGTNKLVLCEAQDSENNPIEGNHRLECAQAMEAVKDLKPWFGMEQEYILFGLDGLPFGWTGTRSTGTIPLASAGVGLKKVFGRDVCMSHYNACLYAGLKIFGTTGEALRSQWEFQVGPCEGVELADQVWMARYILHRVCEDFGVVPCFDPKPIPDVKSGSGGHMNFSTEDMRSEGGIKHIEKAIQRLSLCHMDHMRLYDPSGGVDNQKRLTGASRAYSVFSDFTWGVADRKASVRIPAHMSKSGCGYFEDRRPAANCDPYLVTKLLAETCLLTEDHRKNK